MAGINEPSSLMCLVLGTLGSGGMTGSFALRLRFSPGVLDVPAAGTEPRVAKTLDEPSSGLDGLEEEYRRFCRELGW